MDFIKKRFKRSKKYKVYSGSFDNKFNAENQMFLLKSHNIDAYLDYFSPLKRWRVLTGVYCSEKDAMKRIEFIKQRGYKSFLWIEDN